MRRSWHGIGSRRKQRLRPRNPKRSLLFPPELPCAAARPNSRPRSTLSALLRLLSFLHFTPDCPDRDCPDEKIAPSGGPTPGDGLGDRRHQPSPVILRRSPRAASPAVVQLNSPYHKKTGPIVLGVILDVGRRFGRSVLTGHCQFAQCGLADWHTCTVYD